ncbi:holin [Brevibacillus brevis]|uniref:phage holin family protein n=1 Tax=Brevibacillus brevis TaxID=1393 RepID=UPI0019013578|nr:phage holin family protein [Brevibacillus brevis]MBH0328272.1 holin [Brevibacillus brevis]
MDFRQLAFTAAIGVNNKEATFGGILAVAGTTITAFLGGWDAALKLLFYAMIVDYVTGVAGAIKNKNVNSEIMFWGGIRKGITLLIVGLAVLTDQLIGNETPVFRTLALYFYIGREGLSILENFGHLGMSYPTFLRQILEQLKERGDGQKK